MYLVIVIIPKEIKYINSKIAHFITFFTKNNYFKHVNRPFSQTPDELQKHPTIS